MITFDLIKEIAAAFPGTEESTSYGTPAIKVGKKLVLRLHNKEDAIVMLLDSVEEQQRLIAADPRAAPPPAPPTLVRSFQGQTGQPLRT